MSGSKQEIKEFAARLKSLSDELASADFSGLRSAAARETRMQIAEACEQLRQVIITLDPVKQPDFIFDPSNPRVVGRMIGVTMLAQERKPLSTIESFYGSGVYALYYTGAFPAYAAISGKEHPIYVGKADPAKPSARTAVEQENRLARRLEDHQKNIAKTSTLNLDDFQFRALVIQSGWETGAENFLIHLFRPIWNSQTKICDGFGKHGDSSKTRSNQRSPWDTLHPGRSWAGDLTINDRRSGDDIIRRIEAHFERHPPIKTFDEILRKFVDELRG